MFSLSFGINHLSLACARTIYMTNTFAPPQQKVTLTVWLWSVVLPAVLLSGKITSLLLVLLSFVRRFYTVFSSSLQKLQAFSGLANNIILWQSDQNVCFKSAVAFSNASIHCQAVLYTSFWDSSFWIMWRGKSIFHQRAPNRVFRYIFQLHRSVWSYMLGIHICVYIHKLSYIQRKGVLMNFTLFMPTNKSRNVRCDGYH